MVRSGMGNRIHLDENDGELKCGTKQMQRQRAGSAKELAGSLKESCVRRRYSDFEWLRSELERESKVVVPPLPGKAFLRQLPFRGDDGIFDDSFIEERKLGLEQFINKVAGHPLAQNERCLHMFLQDEIIDKSYTPSKIRHA
ncbi:putative Sorting nexin-3 protein [Naja naja]|nr:putative Sorting nexin-3 protein [Naja naja]